jgi:hypothetical protein
LKYVIYCCPLNESIDSKIVTWMVMQTFQNWAGSNNALWMGRLLVVMITSLSMIIGIMMVPILRKGLVVTGLTVIGIFVAAAIKELMVRFSKLVVARILTFVDVEAMSVNYLDLSNRNDLTADDFKKLARYINLLHLDLSGTRITDQDLVHISRLPLHTLILANNPCVTDRGLVHLRRMLLHRLDLGATGVQGPGFACLNTSLRHLELYRTEIMDQGLEHLKSLTGLQHLNLWNTWISDHGLVHLKPLTGLRVLDLTDTRITQEKLVCLKQVTCIKY